MTKISKIFSNVRLSETTHFSSMTEMQTPGILSTRIPVACTTKQDFLLILSFIHNVNILQFVVWLCSIHCFS